MKMTTNIADQLVVTVEEATQKLRQLDLATVSHRPAPERWTIKEVIGHLIDSASNNHQRFVRAQFVQELVFPKYEQNEWVRCQAYNDVAWEEPIGLWHHYNLHLAHIIRHLPPTSLAVRCVIGDNDPVTLQFLIQDYLEHLQHHLRKISERLAAPR